MDTGFLKIRNRISDLFYGMCSTNSLQPCIGKCLNTKTDSVNTQLLIQHCLFLCHILWIALYRPFIIVI